MKGLISKASCWQLLGRGNEALLLDLLQVIQIAPPRQKSRSSLPLAPQAILGCLIQFPLSFVFVHTSLSVGQIFEHALCASPEYKAAEILPTNSYNQGGPRIGERGNGCWLHSQRTFLKKGVNGLRLHTAVGCLRLVAACERSPSKESRRYQSRKKRPGASRCLEGHTDREGRRRLGGQRPSEAR